MYRVAIKVEAEFIDFEQLSTFLDKWALEDGVEVGSTDWDVTEENRRAMKRRCGRRPSPTPPPRRRPTPPPPAGGLSRPCSWPTPACSATTTGRPAR